MKNERAAIMALTFCIGFTTGLIAYGIPDPAEPFVYVPTISQPAVVAESQPSLKSVAKDSPIQNSQSVLITDDGLYHLTGNEQTLISPTVTFAGDIPEAHTAVHGVSVSPDNQFVFFCAETSARDGVCFPRVYSAASFSTHGVTIAGDSVTLDPDDIDVAWSGGDRLVVNGFTSASATQPWLLQ